MKKISTRLLVLSLLLTFLLGQNIFFPVAKADEVGQCGEPYFETVERCAFWGMWCGPETEACVDCDGGKYCYPT